MSNIQPIRPLEGSSPVRTSPVRASRTPASGVCGCVRRSCWHQRQCRSSGTVRVLRIAEADNDDRSSVVLCRECAAPTQRKRVS